MDRIKGVAGRESRTRRRGVLPEAEIFFLTMVKTVPRGVIEHWFVMVSPLCFWPLQSRSPCCTVASNCSTSGSQGLQLEDLTQRVKGQTHLLGSPKARILSIAISHPCLIPLFVVVSGPWVRFRFSVAGNRRLKIAVAN